MHNMESTVVKLKWSNFQFNNEDSLNLRFLRPSDVDEVRKLCVEWFPVDYPDTWYQEITSSSRFFSLAALHQQGTIIGLIIAEIKPYSQLNKEDRGILSIGLSGNSDHIEAAYILSLGVSEAYRRRGVASLLLDQLIRHLTATDRRRTCRAVFLHVLTTNQPAILFYEARNFKLQSFLPYYYLINGRCRDGFTYVLYLNGGHPPWGPCDYFVYYCKTLCDPKYIIWSWRQLWTAWNWLWQKISY